MTRATFNDVTAALSRAGVPTRELHGHGHAAVTLAGGRVVALAFERGGANLLWSNPLLNNSDLVKNQPDTLVGGYGGDRLWFAAELEFHWKGVPDWAEVTNYEVPAATDPGRYRFRDIADEAVTLQSSGQLVSHIDGHRVGFDVTRNIRLVSPPLARSDPLQRRVRYAGIETSHLLQLDEMTRFGKLGLWHLLQVPVGSILIVPLKRNAREAAKIPLSYALPGEWICHPDVVLWRFGGTAHAKMGISAGALTGRTAVLQQIGSDYALIVRQFEVNERWNYVDHPYGIPRTDQAFQAWDGMGFGEMEHHGACIDAQAGPWIHNESDQLWAFGGAKTDILSLARHILSIDISRAFDLLDENLSGRW